MICSNRSVINFRYIFCFTHRPFGYTCPTEQYSYRMYALISYYTIQVLSVRKVVHFSMLKTSVPGWKERSGLRLVRPAFQRLYHYKLLMLSPPNPPLTPTSQNWSRYIYLLPAAQYVSPVGLHSLPREPSHVLRVPTFTRINCHSAPPIWIPPQAFFSSRGHPS